MPIVVNPEPVGERLLLTRRSQTLRRQPGDIAFPGGGVDPEDPSPLATALRESHEEVGLSSDDVTVLGQMDERGTVTGFCITPFVAYQMDRSSRCTTITSKSTISGELRVS